MATFLEKNKKKSSLALLLLLLRAKKMVTLLLVLVALTTFVFVAPSKFLLGLPGGARAAAGVAWIAGKLGVDTSQWGLAGGRRDYGDLLAAFRAAKEGGGKAGWSSFMRGGGGTGGGKLGGSSLDFVRGDAKDLAAKGASGDKLPKPGSVGGVLNPDDAKNRAEGEGVPLSEEELSGKRSGGSVKTAFAGGFGSPSAFGNSSFGTRGGIPTGANTSASSGPGSNTAGFGSGPGSGSGAEGGLSGGAYAGLGLSGSGGSGSTPGIGDVVKAGTIGPPGGMPRGFRPQGGVSGRMSTSRVTTMSNTVAAGLVGSSELSGQRAFVQLAFGNGRASISVAPNCSGSCPGEFAATNTGTVYDGNDVFGNNFNLDGTPTSNILLTQFDMPNPNLPGGAGADAEVLRATQMSECADAVQRCEAARVPDVRRFEQLEIQIKGWRGQLPDACDDKCKCAPCGDLKKNILRVCDGELNAVIQRIKVPCSLPSFCAALGVSPPAGSAVSPVVDLCSNINMVNCACPDPYPCCGRACRIRCFVPGIP